MRSAKEIAERWLGQFYHMSEYNPTRSENMLIAEIEKAQTESYIAGLQKARTFAVDVNEWDVIESIDKEIKRARK